MKPYISNLAILICVVLCFNSCKEKTASETEITQTEALSSPGDSKVDTKVVLQVGSGQFTVFEVEKNFKIFKQKFVQNNHREPAEDDIKAWVKEFTERAYVLADAKAKGYYDRTDVKNEVESTATLMITQPHGLLEKKLTMKATPLVATNPADVQKERMALVNEYHTKVNNSASVKLDKPAIAWLQTVFNKDKKKNEVKKEALADDLAKPLATYRAPDGETKVISVEQFMNYYNNLPLRRYLNDTTVITGYLHQIAANTYIEKDAEKMGITNDPEFRLNKKNYTDNVVYQKYMAEQLGSDRGVTESDIIDIYSSVKQIMTHPTNIVYSIYTFSNPPNAYKALGLLRMHPNDTTVNLNSLSQKRHIRFDKNQSQLPDTLKKMLYRGAPGQPLPPVETNGYYTVLMIESATGSEPFKANEIRPYLVARAREKRELNYASKKAAGLSKNLKAENAININMFTASKLTSSL